MSDEPMPMFVQDLEQRLRDEAMQGSPGRRPRPARRSPRLGPAVPAVVGALLIALVLVLTHRDQEVEPRATGDRPLILETAAAENSEEIISQVEQGQGAKSVLGDARFTQALPIPAFGGTGYVLTGPAGWCLLAPDTAMGTRNNPARVGGASTCQPKEMIDRFGIALVVGHNGIAALPQGVPAPTLTAPDGTVETLEPSHQGVVTFEDRPSHTALTMHSADGGRVTLHVP